MHEEMAERDSSESTCCEATTGEDRTAAPHRIAELNSAFNDLT